MTNSATPTSPIPWKHVRNVLVLFAPLWVGTTVFFLLAGVAYCLIRSDSYTSKIGLVVRDEAASSSDRLGRFQSQTEMKAAQETILEMVQNPETISEALKSIGPADGSLDVEYPSRKVIDAAREDVNLIAPQGAEFGNSEVVYLQAKAKSKDRSAKFCEAMFAALTEKLRMVRRLRADSVIDELKAARDLARSNLATVAADLREMEVRFGQDLGELRNLRDTISGEGSNRRALDALLTQLQTAEVEYERMQSLESILHRGAADPNELLIAGSDLLTGQPSLQRLKDGLIDAQLASSRLAGLFTAENPKRRAAEQTEKEIRTRMQSECKNAVRAMAPALELQRDLVSRLQGRREQLKNRLDHLAKFRTEYASIDAEVKQRTELLASAEQSLSDAIAARSAALSTNLIARFGKTRTSDKPAGPGGVTVAGGATMAGLMFGLGVVFLVAPGPSQVRRGRRWSDYLGNGRRASDRVQGNAVQGNAVQGNPVQGNPVQGNPDQGNPDQGNPVQGNPDEADRRVANRPNAQSQTGGLDRRNR